MRDGKSLTIDEPYIVRRAEEIGHAVWDRLVSQYPNVPFPIALPPRDWVGLELPESEEVFP